MPSGSLIALVLAFNAFANADTTEYIAFVVPQYEGAITWKEVTYPSNFTATSASEVTMTSISGTVSALGNWQDLSFGSA